MTKNCLMNKGKEKAPPEPYQHHYNYGPKKKSKYIYDLTEKESSSGTNEPENNMNQGKEAAKEANVAADIHCANSCRLCCGAHK